MLSGARMQLERGDTYKIVLPSCLGSVQHGRMKEWVKPIPLHTTESEQSQGLGSSSEHRAISKSTLSKQLEQTGREGGVMRMLYC